MGSYDPSPTDVSNDIHILVTGFGLFHSHASNPSWLIASSLPPAIACAGRRVYIHTLPGAVEVSYQRICATMPGLLFPKGGSTPAYDLVLHIGMHGKRDFYAIETQAHRDGYEMEDVTGKTLGEDVFWKTELKAPEVLTTGVNALQVLKKWKQSLPDMDIQLSDDAGRYLCEFTHYTSMLEYWRRDPMANRPVVFMHTPPAGDEKAVKEGAQVALGLIVSLVESQI